MTAWTNPKTWAVDDFPTAALLNAHLRDNLLTLLHPFHTENTLIDVTNTGAETSLFSTAPTVLANTLGVSGHIHAELFGDYINNLPDGMTLRIKLGGTTVSQILVTAPFAWNGSRHSYKLVVDLLNLGATNSQMIYVALEGTSADAADTGSFIVSRILRAQKQDTATIDTTADRVFDITVDWFSASGSTSWRKRASRVLLAQA